MYNLCLYGLEEQTQLEVKEFHFLQLDINWLLSPGIPCPPGTYGNTTGLASVSDCTMCDSGWYCPMPGLTQPWDLCDPGHYCELGADRSNPFNETTGYLCPTGHHCPEGTNVPMPCDRGYYQPLTGQF